MTLVIVFFATFLYASLRAFQQKNVTGDKYLLVMPTSMIMAFADIYLISTVAKTGVDWIVIPYGLGAGIGAIVAMKLHNHFMGSVDGK
jgi:hypothetical protein